MAKDERYKSDGSDQYGRPKTKITGIDSYLANPTTGVSKGYLAPLDIGFSLFDERKFNKGPLSKDEKASRSKMNADAKEKGKYMKAALSKAAQKAKPVKPTPKPPMTKNAPMPGKPDYNTKNAPMPNKSKTNKKYYGGA